jgi:hypothetical protein
VSRLYDTDGVITADYFESHENLNYPQSQFGTGAEACA